MCIHPIPARWNLKKNHLRRLPLFIAPRGEGPVFLLACISSFGFLSIICCRLWNFPPPLIIFHFEAICKWYVNPINPNSVFIKIRILFYAWKWVIKAKNISQSFRYSKSSRCINNSQALKADLQRCLPITARKERRSSSSICMCIHPLASDFNLQL